MNSFVIKHPHITERSTDLQAEGKYVFMVASGASKPEIKKAVKAVYKVDAVAVNIINLPGKNKRFRGVLHGKPQGSRKAIVTLKKGQKIDLA